ncbi:protein pelota homolog [Apostichopus japonicus]|uniref:protein pelota homolog n=1 Tax=Stichopus japonicus TaxID=307972 RepID=UPI003AB8C51E
MKQVHRHLEKDGSGQIGLIPEEPEDMWHAYNLVAAGDSLRSTTVRKVTMESSTGSSTSNRVRTTLTISVEDLDFDVQAGVLRVKGRNIAENPYVKMGAYHTLDLELNRKFTLAKKVWDVVALDRIDMACDVTQSADVAAVVLQEGLAHVCLVTPSMTLVRTKVEHTIPRKRKGLCGRHDKGLIKFYDAVMQGILRHIKFDVVKCIIIASPGFVKDQFYEYLFQEAGKQDNKILLENKSKFILVHASSGHKHVLKEILADPALQVKLADTKASGEVRALESFYSMLQTEPDRAFYGLKCVEAANEALAIETLLISDELFRSKDIATRKRYVSLVESVRDNGGEVKLFSSLHVSGEQLNQLTGVCALLRFPMPEIEEDDEDSSSDED